MAATASPIPAIFLAGMTQDAPFQPLSDIGAPNPAFYHTFFRDMDNAADFLTTNGAFTLSGTSATWAAAAGSGGLGVLATEAVANQIAQLQAGTVGTFFQNIRPKKLAFETRVSASANSANGRWLFGLCNVGAAITAGTGAVAVTDGIYFLYVGSTGVLTINQATGSVVTSATIPTGSFNAGASIDLAFHQNRNGDIIAFADSALVGFIPQSQINTPGNPLNAGPTARILASAYTASAVGLVPTAAVWESNGTIASVTLDFLTAMQER